MKKTYWLLGIAFITACGNNETTKEAPAAKKAYRCTDISTSGLKGPVKEDTAKTFMVRQEGTDWVIADTAVYTYTVIHYNTEGYIISSENYDYAHGTSTLSYITTVKRNDSTTEAISKDAKNNIINTSITSYTTNSTSETTVKNNKGETILLLKNIVDADCRQLSDSSTYFSNGKPEFTNIMTSSYLADGYSRNLSVSTKSHTSANLPEMSASGSFKVLETDKAGNPVKILSLLQSPEGVDNTIIMHSYQYY